VVANVMTSITAEIDKLVQAALSKAVT
jgi:hypothetical protein